MEAMLECCCGIDVHKEVIVACILSGATDATPAEVMDRFGTQYDDLTSLAIWLDKHSCKHIAMESTGSFWMPIYNRLTELGASCIVVNAQRVKNVPGRKTDWNDARWIADLFRHGLLPASFVPMREQQILRSHTRALESLTQDRSREKNRVERLLQAEGFKLSTVLEDIFSLTGRALLDILVKNGKVTLRDVVKHRNCNCKNSAETIARAMRGDLSAQMRKLLDFKLRQIDDYDRQIDELQELIEEVMLPFDDAADLIDSIPGIARHAAVQIIAEIGANMDTFQSAEHIASWAGLSPRSSQSAGKKSPLASCPATVTSNAFSTNALGAAPAPVTLHDYEIGFGLFRDAQARKKQSSHSPVKFLSPYGPCSSPVSSTTPISPTTPHLDTSSPFFLLSSFWALASFSFLLSGLFS